MTCNLFIRIHKSKKMSVSCYKITKKYTESFEFNNESIGKVIEHVTNMNYLLNYYVFLLNIVNHEYKTRDLHTKIFLLTYADERNVQLSDLLSVLLDTCKTNINKLLDFYLRLSQVTGNNSWFNYKCRGNMNNSYFNIYCENCTNCVECVYCVNCDNISRSNRIIN